MKHPPPTIWFTGLSASGKTTLSTKLYNDLKNLGIDNVVLLDGEALRDKLNNHHFDTKNREKIGFQKAKIASDLNDSGKIVLISGIAHKRKWRNDIRNMLKNYFEIFLDCSVENCIKRDFKGHYQKAISGKLKNFIGISESYEVSDKFDLILDTGQLSIEICSEKILKKVLDLINEEKLNEN